MALAGCPMRWRRMPLLCIENFWLFIDSLLFLSEQQLSVRPASYREHSEEVYCLFQAFRI
jgi:hypothetical protein